MTKNGVKWNMRTTKLQLLVIAVVACLSFVARAGEKAAENARLNADVLAAIDAFKRADSSMANTFESAAGYAVFPNVGKGGLVFGGAHGNGQVYEAGKLVGYASLTQFTFGAQIGGQSFSEVIFFETKQALEEFKKSQFTMNAQVGAVAAAEGASKNAKYTDGVMIFTQPKSGLMAEASVGGQKFKFKPATE